MRLLGWVFVIGVVGCSETRLPDSVSRRSDALAGPSMIVPRASHTATVLTDGRILMAGGYSDAGTFGMETNPSAELYDPATNSFTATGPISTGRFRHTATRLNDGRVLIVGGFGMGGQQPLPEPGANLYDPATNTWADAAAPMIPRADHAAVLLPNGKVLVAGGKKNPYEITGVVYLKSAELYDPVANTWSPAASMMGARAFLALVNLSGGKVLATAGLNGVYDDSKLCEIYDPATDTWSPTGAQTQIHYQGTVTTLPDGRVLIIGGRVASHVVAHSAETYDPATGQWSMSSLNFADRRFQTSTLLPDGTVYATALQQSTASVGPNRPYIYDPVANTWTQVPLLATTRETHTATLLADGRLLIAGGAPSPGFFYNIIIPALATTELVDPSLGAGCSTTATCLSGFCVDGVCCESACGAACDSCNQPGKAGLCRPRPINTAGGPGCDPYLCNGAVVTCPTSCSSDASCLPTYYCSANVCIPIGSGAAGTECRAGPQCSNGFCENGVCCGSPCSGECNACDVPGLLGVCTTAPAGRRGEPTCGAMLCDGNTTTCPITCTSDASCETTHQCLGGACVIKPSNGTACTAGVECLSGFCSDGVCCSAACGEACDACTVPGFVGTCRTQNGGGIADSTCGYLCDGASTNCPLAACATDANCGPAFRCVASACVPRGINGAACTEGLECLSGRCSLKVCCASACDSCAACNVPGSLGTCAPVAKGTNNCPAYLCDGTSSGCPTTCATSADCDDITYCSNGACVPRLTNGLSCTTADQCNSRICVEGLCCNAICDGACEACNLLNTRGTCTVIPAGSDGAPSCAPYMCNGAASCPTSCVFDDECLLHTKCVDGICAQQPLPDAGTKPVVPPKKDAGSGPAPEPAGCGCSAMGSAPLWLLLLGLLRRKTVDRLR